MALDSIPDPQGSQGSNQADVQRVLYGRRMGRPLRPHRQALVDGLLPTIELAVPVSGEFEPPGALFKNSFADYWLEIGFGGGEHLSWQARANPEIGIIGCEPYINGVARLLSDISENDLGNIRIFRDDARLLLAGIPEASFSRIFILFPDPWPKTRHHKRRLINAQTIPDLARILRNGGELRIATDDPSYKGWILRHMLASHDFEWQARRPSDWRVRPKDWPPTRYEQKAEKAGRKAAFFSFIRRAGDV